MSSAARALIQEDSNFVKEDCRIEKDTKYSWFVCSCAFFSQVFVFGVLHAYGVFFVEFLKDFKTSKGEAAWIGSLAYGLSMTFGPVTSVLITRYGYRRIMMSGGLICGCSLLASSFSTSILMLFLTFSVTYGIGTCMTTSPTMTITSDYFDRYLSIATGITVAGSSFGTLIMGPLSQLIIDISGWRTAFRVYAGLCISTVIFNSRIKPLSKPSQRKIEGRSFIHDLQIWKNRVFVIWTFSIAMVMFGFYIPYVHLVSYAIDQGISPDRASIYMLVLGATTATGRILFGKIVQWGILNRLHMHQLSMVVTGTGVMMLPLIKSFGGIMVYVLVVGLVDGCFVVLLPIMTASLVGVENSVLAWGFMIGTCSITFTIGPPVAGALYDMTGTYNLSFHCAGVPILAGATLLFLIPWAQRTSSTSNVLEIINDYTINDTVVSSRVSNGTYPCDSTRTVCQDEEVRHIDVIRSHVSIRTTGTSPIYPESFIDKSVGTDDFPLHHFPMDIEDALSQLSTNDRVFDDMLCQSYSSTTNPSRPLSDVSVEILRIPPPRDSLRSRTASDHSANTDMSHEKFTLNSYCQPSLTSANDESENSSFAQPSILSDHLRSVKSESRDSCLPSESDVVLSNNNEPFESAHSSSSARANQILRSLSVNIGSSNGDTDPTKRPSDFDQAICEQVNLIRETLKSPTTTNMDLTASISNQYPVISTLETNCPDIKIQAPTPVQSFNAAENAKQFIAESSDTGPPIVGPSAIHSAPLFTDAIWEKEPHAVSDSKFEYDNQITVIPGNNPFISGGKKLDSSESSGVKLEDLFKPIKSEEDTSDVSVIESNDAIVATKSQTSELDVFKHLFDDEEAQ